ncbi:hypothetical protein HDV63DRAFT_233999 [Trichoderma sp. SZMC 28014]
MSDIAPFCVYLHGCPGFHNLEIAKELSTLIKGSKVLRMGSNHHRDWRYVLVDDPSVLRCILDNAHSDINQAKQHSWIFSDFRGCATEYASMIMPVEEYENAADNLGQPFVRVILRCLSERLDTYSRLGRSVPFTNAHEFPVFEAIWNEEHIRASGKATEMEVDIGDLGPKEAAKMIFQGISNILHL